VSSHQTNDAVVWSVRLESSSTIVSLTEIIASDIRGQQLGYWPTLNWLAAATMPSRWFAVVNVCVFTAIVLLSDAAQTQHSSLVTSHSSHLDISPRVAFQGSVSGRP